MQSLTHTGWLATVLSAMAHIHEKIDFTVAIFVVHDRKVLLIHHRRLDKWLPLGGHVELDEEPEQAALRETREESGFEVELIGEGKKLVQKRQAIKAGELVVLAGPDKNDTAWFVILHQQER